jgi:DNA-binding Lrp family transcriptional regulator
LQKKLDELDFKILEALLDNGRIKFKTLAKNLDTDERMISRRVDRLIEEGIIRKFSIDIDWPKLGFNLEAYVCTKTGIGEDLRKNLYEFFENHPRIVSVDSTIGAYEYIAHTISTDIQDFRTKIGMPLETLTAGLATSITSEHIKPTDYKPLLRIIRQKEGR